MRISFYWIVSIPLFCLLGVLWYAYLQEIIIVRIPHTAHSSHTHAIFKKDISLILFYENSWHTDIKELLWHEHLDQNIQSLLTMWLTTLHEEQPTDKKVGISAVLLTISGTHAFISFDRNPFFKEQSIFEKWMYIEGILATLRANAIAITHVTFLVQHTPLYDRHIDFSQPWPLKGFYKELQ